MNHQLAIKIENGQIVGHPMLLSNLSSIIPNFDPYNLPEGYVYFERIVQPDLKWYEKSFSHSYGFVDGVVKDIWTIESMTPDERQQARSILQTQWMNLTGYASWIWNEETGSYDPPIPYPEDGKFYTWNENTGIWVAVATE